MDELGSTLVKAAKWVGRGVGLALDYLNLREGIKALRNDARRNRR